LSFKKDDSTDTSETLVTVTSGTEGITGDTSVLLNVVTTRTGRQGLTINQIVAFGSSVTLRKGLAVVTALTARVAAGPGEEVRSCASETGVAVRPGTGQTAVGTGVTFIVLQVGLRSASQTFHFGTLGTIVTAGETAAAL
jgi:hypothetical protein